MKRIAAILSSFFIAAGLAAAAANPPQPLDALKQRAEQARGGDKVRLCMDIARAQLQHADDLYRAGDNDNARRALEDVARYSEQAGAASAQSRKHMKDTEIGLRRIARRLEDIARGVEFDERTPVKQIIDRVEKSRTDLLAALFR